MTVEDVEQALGVEVTVRLHHLDNEPPLVLSEDSPGVGVLIGLEGGGLVVDTYAPADTPAEVFNKFGEALSLIAEAIERDEQESE